jgi:uncharacterized protein (TIGR02466 family)
MDESKILTLFPSVLLHTRVTDHAAISKRLLPEIDKIRLEVPNGPAARWASPVFSTLTTDPSLHRRDAFREIAGIFHEETLAFAQKKSVDLESQEIHIDRCWLNVLSRSNSMDVHNHPNSFFTGIYFLQAPTDGARFSLHNPTQGIGLSVPVKKQTTLNQEGYIYQPMAGDLLIFESCITHSFHVHESDQEHINLSFTAVGPVSSVMFPS